MKAIFKYSLTLAYSQAVDLPIGAKPLSIQMQGGGVCLWALVETSVPSTLKTVRMYGTGHDCSDLAATSQFLGTIQLSGGSLVFRFFID